MIAALILAAGKGERFGRDPHPKQYSNLCGKPLFVHSVSTYGAMPEIDRIVLTFDTDCEDLVQTSLEQHGLVDAVDLVPGGATRQASIGNAAAALGSLDALDRNDMIVVHNAASPNTRAAFVRECIEAMEGFDAVQACVPDTRTVFERTDKVVSRVLPRAHLVYNCDPLIYRADVFARLIQTQHERGTTGETTSDTALELGYQLRLVESSYDNIKVTTRWDIYAIEAAMQDGSAS
ncbi:MAG: 2-C-methyl-D-erythritol 4-phosphate cytidylyltransferase [Acidimicrobiia bacterium]|nr:2-C-methyl-D-erythritol 4-phosphate cytidylyltransferase [Acidimicrobiia bacterium]